MFTHEFMQRRGMPPKILIVAPNTNISNNFAADAVRLFPEGTFQILSKKGVINIKGVTFATYQSLLKQSQDGRIDSDYDLAIFDEAQKIRGAKDERGLVTDALNATHRVYMTATPAEKVEQLRIIAKALNTSFSSFILNLHPGLVLSQSGTHLEYPPQFSIELFNENLKAKLQELADQYRYVRRAYPRKAPIERVPIQVTKADDSPGEAAVPLTDGSSVSPFEAEQMVKRSHNNLARAQEKGNLGHLWSASAYLSELAKLPKTYELVKKALASNKKAVVFFSRARSRSEKAEAVPLYDASGNKIRFLRTRGDRPILSTLYEAATNTRSERGGGGQCGGWIKRWTKKRKKSGRRDSEYHRNVRKAHRRDGKAERPDSKSKGVICRGMNAIAASISRPWRP